MSLLRPAPGGAPRTGLRRSHSLGCHPGVAAVVRARLAWLAAHLSPDDHLRALLIASEAASACVRRAERLGAREPIALEALVDFRSVRIEVSHPGVEPVSPELRGSPAGRLTALALVRRLAGRHGVAAARLWFELPRRGRGGRPDGRPSGPSVVPMAPAAGR